MPVLTIVGKTWLLHVTEILRTTPEENLAMIEDSVRHLVAQGREVIYDAEHFFDGYLDDPEYALRTLDAAARGGAANLTLCETNGGTLVPQVAGDRGARRARFGGEQRRRALPQRQRPGRRRLARRRRRGRHPRPGHDERLRRARRQRQPHRPSCPTSS